MSHSRSRRKSNRKLASIFKEPPGRLIQFRWSVSAAHSALLEDKPSVIFPSIDINRSRRKYFVSSSSLIDQNLVSPSQISSEKIPSLPNITKISQSSLLNEQDKISTQNSPLSLTYAQLYEVSPSSKVKSPRGTRLSIYSLAEEKRNSISLLNSKVCFKSRPSITSTTTISLLTPTPDHQLSNDNLVRLHTPQLRRLNVSEKYMDEAKKLYFNANSRSFVPLA